MERVFEEHPSWLDQPLGETPVDGPKPASSSIVNWETILFSVILVLAIVSRFYLLEPRVMSHDETSHVYFSWKLYQGEGFQHDPMMHGPLQFHLVALSFLLFGDNDFTARIPAVLFSIATVAFMWNYRRYLGRIGALIAAVLFLISPYMLYYGRYVRNEAFVGLFGVMTLWAVLRYFETGQMRYTMWLSGVMALHFITKETSYIYTAQLLLFLGLFFVFRQFRLSGKGNKARPTYPGHQRVRFTKKQKQYFLLALIGVPVLLGITLLYGYSYLQGSSSVGRLVDYASATTLTQRLGAIPHILIIILPALIPAAGLLYCGYLLGQLVGGIWSYGRERSFDLLMLVGTLILPALSAFLIQFYADPAASDLANIVLMAVMLLPMLALSVGLGIGWNQHLWLANAGLYYGIFIVFYTTFFTNIAGFFTGIVGSLGYWLAQQAVQRGSQPWFYYALIQIPMYEFLPAMGCLLAAGILIYRLLSGKWRYADDKSLPLGFQENSVSTPLKGFRKVFTPFTSPSAIEWQHPPVLRLITFWVVTSLVAFTYAGEKMPWLTVHIALPMILLAGWAIGQLIETTDWVEIRNRQGWVLVALLPLFLTSMVGLLSGINNLVLILRSGTTTSNLDQWTIIGQVLITLLSAVGSAIWIAHLLKDWLPDQFLRVFGVLTFLVLGVLTARTAMMAAYQNFDQATEYLVFAHCGSGPKLAYQQIEALSERLTGGTDIQVAYDDKTTYPFWWYLRDYPNNRYYADTPNRDLSEVPLILVGDGNYAKVESIVRDDYYAFEYVRIWWPNQDYLVYRWTPTRIWETLTEPDKRQAILDIWLNRDYTRYGEIFQKDMSLTNWDPSEHFRLYVRKDIATQLWSYSSNPQAPTGPYDGKLVSLASDRIIGSAGTAPGQFTGPRGIAVAPDGSLYVVDTGNSRIQHLSPQGEVLHVWGSRYEGEGAAPPGQFKEPWAVAVGGDGSVYVADTWNHRVQKFTADGQFLTAWGSGILSDPTNLLGFFGPRGIATNSQGEVFVADTGNKRIVFFGAEGKPLGQFGEGGSDSGQLDEPVGLAFDSDGNLYIADTWNQRVQVFDRELSGAYTFVSEWDVRGWDGISATNYPYLAVAADKNLPYAGHVFVTDPDNGRVIEFTNGGEIVRYWEDGGENGGTFNLPVGIAFDPQGGLWVVDSGNCRLLHFSLLE